MALSWNFEWDVFSEKKGVRPNGTQNGPFHIRASVKKGPKRVRKNGAQADPKMEFGGPKNK